MSKVEPAIIKSAPKTALNVNGDCRKIIEKITTYKILKRSNATIQPGLL